MWKNLCDLCEKEEIDGVLLTSRANMHYFSGFSGEGSLYVSKDRRLLFTDSRYTIVAKEECPDWEVMDVRGDALTGLLECLGKSDVKIGYEDQDVVVSQYRKISKHFNLIPLGPQCSTYREIKTKDEIACIRKAEEIGDKAFSRVLPQLQAGMTELMVAAKLEYEMKCLGAERLSFDTIAASGENSAKPHAVPGERVLQEKDFLTMDFGCVYKGYCSDMTRTVVVGEPSEKMKEIYAVVKEAQERALAGIRPGVACRTIDELARGYICERGYGDCFGHVLGHSVGLEIHEHPCFSPKDETILQPGMVITVEPGIYVDSLGGVRIEDLIAVTEQGYENLTHSPKGLIQI